MFKVILITILFFISCESSKERCIETKEFYFQLCLLTGLENQSNGETFLNYNQLYCGLYLDYDRICKKKSGTIPFP